MQRNPSVLFVCLGNICRSPLAEAAFRNEIAALEIEVEVDSAGTSNWHVGESPDSRAIAIAAEKGVDIGAYRGRQIVAADYDKFTHIVALDDENLATLEVRQPRGSSAQLSLLLDHVPGREGEGVADPYFGGADGFDQTWADVSEAARALAKSFVSGR